MKISKEGSADFLFGNTKKISNMDTKSKLPETRSKIIDGLIILVLLSQVIYLGISSYVYQNFLSVSFEINYFILFAIIIYSVIEAMKNFFQLSNFGENEFNQSKFSILFMIIQGAISYSFVWILYMILDILIGENQDLSSNLLFFLGSSMIIFTIVKFVSNISLTSKALGQGLIPNLFDINSIKNNFGIFSKTSGKLELNIIFLKILIVSAGYLIMTSEYFTILLILLSVGGTILLQYWEKINAASIIQQVNSIIKDISPSKIPIINNKDGESFILDERTGGYKITGKNNPIQLNLNPVATKSIEKLASSISNENN